VSAISRRCLKIIYLAAKTIKRKKKKIVFIVLRFTKMNELMTD